MAAEKARLDALRAAELDKGAARAQKAEEERLQKDAKTEADTKAKEERLRRQLLRTQRVEKKRTIRKYDEKVSEGF
jgi:hypothetical protein